MVARCVVGRPREETAARDQMHPGVSSARGEQIAVDAIGQRQPDIITSLGNRYPGFGTVASERSQDAIAARAILSLHLRNIVRQGRQLCEILDDPLRTATSWVGKESDRTCKSRWHPYK